MMQMVRADATVIYVEASAICENGGTGRRMRRLAVVEDVTEKRRLTALSHFAVHDALTGLPNRVLLDDRLERACLHHAPPRGAFRGGLSGFGPFQDHRRHARPRGRRRAAEGRGQTVAGCAARVRHGLLARVHEFVDPLDVRGR